MSEIHYETESYYIFDRAYNKFSQLFGINQIGAYFVVRAKKIYNARPSNGNADYLKMYFLIVQLN